MRRYMDIKVVPKAPPTKITVIDGDRAYLIKVLNNKFGNGAWNGKV